MKAPGRPGLLLGPITLGPARIGAQCDGQRTTNVNPPYSHEVGANLSNEQVVFTAIPQDTSRCGFALLALSEGHSNHSGNVPSEFPNTRRACTAITFKVCRRSMKRNDSEFRIYLTTVLHIGICGGNTWAL
jgi:hypothetical protein